MEDGLRFRIIGTCRQEVGCKNAEFVTSILYVGAVFYDNLLRWNLNSASLNFMKKPSRNVAHGLELRSRQIVSIEGSPGLCHFMERVFLVISTSEMFSIHAVGISFGP